MKRKQVIALVVGFVAGVTFGLVVRAFAAAPTVTKTFRTYSSYVYTVAITDPVVSVSGGPRDGNPTTTGGCVNQFRRKANGQQLFLGTTCPTPGTVKFTSPSFPACETPFAINVDGVTVYTDVLNAPCPPPPPPAPVVTVTDTQVVFANPVDGITRDMFRTITVPECGHLSSVDPFTVDCRLNFAGIGLNRYTYWSETIGVTLTPGQTITVQR